MAQALLNDIRAAGVSVTTDGQRILCRPALPSKFHDAIRSRRAELLRLLDLERQAGTVEAFDQAKISELVRRAGPLSESSGAFRKELHRLFDLADEADRAGDVAGLNRSLSTIARLLDGVEGARAPPSAIVGRSKMPWAGQRDLSTVSTQSRASNA